VLATILFVLLQIVSIQSASSSMTPTFTSSQSSSFSSSNSNSGSSSFTNSGSTSFSNTYSTSYSNTYSISYSNTESNTYSTSLSNSYSTSYSTSYSNTFSTLNTNSLTLTVSLSASYSYSISFTPSYTISGTFSVAFGYPQIQGITNTNPNDLDNLNIGWLRPLGFTYQSYQLTFITNGTSITFNDIPTENFVLTPSNTNGLIQPGGVYVVQVKGFVNGAFGPQSLPFSTSTFAGDPYGPTGGDSNSVNNLLCYYKPKNLRCLWNTGIRQWINATFYLNCSRVVEPIMTAQAYIVQKVLNVAGSTALPTLTIVPLPSGCSCTLKFTVFYSTMDNVTLLLPVSGFINTNKAPMSPNTPLTVPA